jgi:quercetin dioxygenase-like cupin family protein
MKLLGCLVIGKDGGDKSTVDGVMFEIKSLFTIGVLRFHPGTREAFHSHAFNCWSIVLKGGLREEFLDENRGVRWHREGDTVTTYRTDVHQVKAVETTYVLTIRGPWAKTWKDVVPCLGYGASYFVDTLTHGRKLLDSVWCSDRQTAAEVAARP